MLVCASFKSFMDSIININTSFRPLSHWLTLSETLYLSDIIFIHISHNCLLFRLYCFGGFGPNINDFMCENGMFTFEESEGYVSSVCGF